MPSRLCITAGCAGTVASGTRCPSCAREQSRLREGRVKRKGQRIYRTKRWQVLRRRVLAEQPLCPCGEIATDVDHVTPLSQGGSVWGRANLQGLCAACHGRKRQWETQREVELEKLLIIVGKPGVGKTAVRDLVAEQMGLTPLGPDDHPSRWDWVIRQVDCNPRPLVECCKVPRSLRARMDTRATLVELVASEEAQRHRLQQQGLDTETVQRRLTEDGAIGYEIRLTPNLTVDVTDLSPQQAAAAICAG